MATTHFLAVREPAGEPPGETPEVPSGPGPLPWRWIAASLVLLVLGCAAAAMARALSWLLFLGGLTLAASLWSLTRWRRERQGPGGS